MAFCILYVNLRQGPFARDPLYKKMTSCEEALEIGDLTNENGCLVIAWQSSVVPSDMSNVDNRFFHSLR